MAIIAALAWIKVHDYNIIQNEQFRVEAKRGKAEDAKTAKATQARSSVDKLPDGGLHDSYFRD